MKYYKYNVSIIRIKFKWVVSGKEYGRTEHYFKSSAEKSFKRFLNCAENKNLNLEVDPSKIPKFGPKYLSLIINNTPYFLRTWPIIKKYY